VTLVLLGIALAAWLWSVGSGQFDDLDKAANSILFEDETPAKLPETPAEGARDQDAS
jgi:cbb3-type cytochrome oxidase maturation protein